MLGRSTVVVKLGDLRRNSTMRYAMLSDEVEGSRKMTFRVQLRKYLTNTRAGYVIDLLNLFFSVLSSLLYIAETYDDGTQDAGNAYNMIDLVLCLFFILDYGIRLFVAHSRWSFITSLYAIIDLLSIVPTLIILQYWLSPDNEVRQLPLYLSIMKVTRILRILRVERFLIYVDSEVNQVLGEIFLRGISAAVFSAGVLQVVDNFWRENNWMATLPFHDYWYFVLVSLSTVGYGDINPESDFAKLYIVFLVLFALYYIPKSTNKLIRLMNMKSVYATDRFKPRGHIKHVVVTGDLMTLDENFFLELFHDDHGADQLEAVLLGEGRPNAAMQQVLKSQQFGQVVTYLEGSPLNERDLGRCCVTSAEAVFVVANKFASDSDEMDAATILRALTIKRHILEKTKCEMMMCIQLLRPENQVHYVACGSSARDSVDQVVCMDEIKMTLLAKTTLCPGMTALIANLITSDEDDSEDAADEGESGEPEWVEEYSHGQGFEIYRTKLSPAFEGIEFSVAADVVYNTLGALLFGVELCSSKEARILLNPGKFVIPDVDEFQVFGFCIAPDKSSIDILSSPSLGKMVQSFLDGGKVERRLSSFKKKPARVVPTDDEEDASMGDRTVDVVLAQSLGEAKKAAQEVADTISPLPKSASPIRGGTTSGWQKMKRSTETVRTDLKSVRHIKTSPSKYFLSSKPVSLLDITVLNSLHQEFPLVENHILVAGNVGSLHYFVKTLRSQHLGYYDPIVVLARQNIPDHVWAKIKNFPGIYYVKGSPLEEMDLRRAGCEKAASAVILANSQSLDTPGSYSLTDAETIFAYQGIKRLNPKIDIVTELVEQSNIDFLDADVEKLNTAASKTPLQMAAGCVYISGMLDTLICQAFYNPQITNVLRKIVAGSDPVADNAWNEKWEERVGSNLQDSHLFQVSIPSEFYGKTYGELFSHFALLEERLLPLALLRGVWGTLNQGPLGNRLPYVYTNPRPGAPLHKGDACFVLASKIPRTLRRQDLSQVTEKARRRSVSDLIAGNSDSHDNLGSLLHEMDEFQKSVNATILSLQEKVKHLNFAEAGEKQEVEDRSETSPSPYNPKEIEQLETLLDQAPHSPKKQP